jgi:hypothetical protein
VGLHLYAEKPIRPSGPPGASTVSRPPVGASARPPAPAPPGRPPAPTPQPVSTTAWPAATSPTPPTAPRGPATAASPAPGPGHAFLRGGRVTPRQLAAIWQVARAKGLEPGAVEAMSLRVFNRKPEALSASEASAFLKELSNLKRSVA